MPASPTTSVPVAPATRAHSYPRAWSIRSPWVWWHLLSLDAPTVAAVWCWFFAETFGIRLPWTVLPTLALGTWWVYVADRLLDGWRSRDMSALRDRHWFYVRHRKAFLAAWMAASIPLAYLIFFQALPSVRTDDIMLCLIGAVYFLLIHGLPTSQDAARWFPKELAVGFLFPIATVVPTWVRLPADHDVLLAAVVAFGAACWLNCVAIQTWEDAEAALEELHAVFSAESNQPGEMPPRGLTEILGNHLTAFAAAVGGLAWLLGSLFATGTPWTLFAAVGLSAVLFLALIRERNRFRALSLRILADSALLTPLIFLARMR